MDKFVCAGCGRQEDKSNASLAWWREPRKYDSVELCSDECRKAWAEGTQFLVQLHWQNRSEPDETEFVAQADAKCPEDIVVWLNGLASDGVTCPEGKVPALLESGHQNFAWSKRMPLPEPPQGIHKTEGPTNG